MKSMIAAIALTVAFCFIAPVAANAQQNEILKRMDLHYKALEDLRADVSREFFNAQLKERDTKTGTVILLPDKKKPKNLRFRLDWKTPRDETIAVLNGKYVLYIPSQKRQYVGAANSKSVKDKGGNALAVMSMTKEEIKTKYTVTYIGTESVGATDTSRIKLIPKAAADYQYIELWVDGNGMPIQAKIVMKNNDYDQIRFSNLKKNSGVKGSEFLPTIPPGTEKIKG